MLLTNTGCCGWLMQGQINGQEGYFPKSFVVMLSKPGKVGVVQLLYNSLIRFCIAYEALLFSVFTITFWSHFSIFYITGLSRYPYAMYLGITKAFLCFRGRFTSCQHCVAFAIEYLRNR